MKRESQFVIPICVVLGRSAFDRALGRCRHRVAPDAAEGTQEPAAARHCAAVPPSGTAAPAVLGSGTVGIGIGTAVIGISSAVLGSGTVVIGIGTAVFPSARAMANECPTIFASASDSAVGAADLVRSFTATFPGLITTPTMRKADGDHASARRDVAMLTWADEFLGSSRSSYSSMVHLRTGRRSQVIEKHATTVYLLSSSKVAHHQNMLYNSNTRAWIPLETNSVASIWTQRRARSPDLLPIYGLVKSPT
jgi:hypothetical protein